MMANHNVLSCQTSDMDNVARTSPSQSRNADDASDNVAETERRSVDGDGSDNVMMETGPFVEVVPSPNDTDGIFPYGDWDEQEEGSERLIYYLGEALRVVDDPNFGKSVLGPSSLPKQ